MTREEVTVWAISAENQSRLATKVGGKWNATGCTDAEGPAFLDDREAGRRGDQSWQG